ARARRDRAGGLADAGVEAALCGGRFGDPRECDHARRLRRAHDLHDDPAPPAVRAEHRAGQAGGAPADGASGGDRLRHAWLRGALLAVGVLAAGALPGAAQQDTASVPPAVREGALRKLRALEQALRPDSAAASADSGAVAGDSAAVADSAAVGAPAFPRLGAPHRDSVLAALRGLSGYTLTEYVGTGARFASDSGRIDLLGRAQITRGTESLSADSLVTFSETSGVVCGYGQPVLTGEGRPVHSEMMCYHLEQQLGEAVGANTTFTQGANWIVRGDRVYTVGSDRAYVHSAVFTDCDLEEPHYHFAAQAVKLVSDDVLVARNVT